MRKLMVLASAALVGGLAFADSIPRVYQYQANLKTTVAKNAATVTWTDDAGEKQTEQDICYRVKGTVTVKGVIVLGCDCNDFDGDLENLEDGYPLVLMATSADKYCQVVFADEEDTWIGGANRFGSPLSCKATSAELEFDVGFEVGPTNSCTRYFELWNAGFGTASKLEAEEGYDITSISGSTAGWADAPYCSAAQNNCPRCLADDDCDFALAFAPCSGADCTVGIDDDEGLDYGVVYGTFTLKYNKALSNVIKPIAQSDVQATINALVPKAFSSCSTPPLYVAESPCDVCDIGVSYNGYCYQALDGTLPTQTSVACQTSYLSLPEGWELVPYSSDIELNVVRAYPWGTHVMVFAEGGGYGTAVYSAGLWDTDRLLVEGSTYKPDNCQLRILIRKPLCEEVPVF